MERLNIEYIAGFFDGEGHVSITESTRNNTRGADPKLTVKLTNTYLPVLSAIKEQYGGNLYKQPKPQKHYLQVYVLSLTVEQSKQFLKDITPYLRIKRKQAETALQFSSTVYRRGKKRVSEDEKQLRKECMETLYKLKREEF